ncbi:MAG: hypothetical protein RLZZ342_262 [Candidatus Parcubacteria bacterium]|jgi:hypothetical protein
MPHKLTPENIARESAKIGGFFPTKRNERDPEYQALIGLYRDVLGSANARLVNPVIFNTVMCRTNGWIHWRTGIPAEFKGLPKAEACQHLYRVWWQAVEREMPRLKLVSDLESREHHCRVAYARFLCIRPFRNGNGRTALLLFYMLRRYMELPLQLIEYENAPELLNYVKKYRRDVFLPEMRERQFMTQHAA